MDASHSSRHLPERAPAFHLPCLPTFQLPNLLQGQGTGAPSAFQPPPWSSLPSTHTTLSSTPFPYRYPYPTWQEQRNLEEQRTRTEHPIYASASASASASPRYHPIPASAPPYVHHPANVWVDDLNQHHQQHQQQHQQHQQRQQHPLHQQQPDPCRSQLPPPPSPSPSQRPPSAPAVVMVRNPLRDVEDHLLYPTMAEEDAIISNQRGLPTDLRQVCPRYTEERCHNLPTCPSVHFRWRAPPTPAHQMRFNFNKAKPTQCRFLNRCGDASIDAAATSAGGGGRGGQKGAKKNPCRGGHFFLVAPPSTTRVQPVPPAASSASASASAAAAATATTDVVAAANGIHNKARPSERPSEFIQGDVTTYDLRILGSNFSVIMYDPPWKVDMYLPYNRMTDWQIDNMPIGELQTQGGMVLLWVSTGNIERGYKILEKNGYLVTDELLWVKINQLHQLLHAWPARTGRLFNHVKEHLIVGVKQGPLFDAMRDRAGIDADVLLAEPRETSRKPDEIYDVINRLCPDGRKLEIFGRPPNLQPGWLTFGDQLHGTHVVDVELCARLKERYGPTLAPPVKINTFVAPVKCATPVTTPTSAATTAAAAATASAAADVGVDAELPQSKRRRFEDHGVTFRSPVSHLLTSPSPQPASSSSSSLVTSASGASASGASVLPVAVVSAPPIDEDGDVDQTVPDSWTRHSASDNILINDYGQHFVNTGGADRPQNFLRVEPTGHEGSDRRTFEGEMHRLVQSSNVAATHLCTDMRDVTVLKERLTPLKFDVVIIDPPWPSRGRTYPTLAPRTWTTRQLETLPISHITHTTSAVFLWVGSSTEEIAAGRALLNTWGFRPMEDIVWLKTNKLAVNRTRGLLRFERSAQTMAMFRSTTEHCLMGVKGFQSLFNDSEARAEVIHRCSDSDVVISEMQPPGNFDKPIAFFEMVERTLRGRRRLHLWGSDQAIRDGWLTVSPDLTHTDTFTTASDFETGVRNKYPSGYTPTNWTITRLRGRSPPGRRNNDNNNTPTSTRASTDGLQAQGPHSLRSMKRGMPTS